MATQQKSTDKATRTANASADTKSTRSKPTETPDDDDVVAQPRTIQRRPLPARTEPNPLVAETLTFSVDLPAHVLEVPEHETAVAIDEVAIDPGLVGIADPTTTTVIQVVATVESPAATAQLAAESGVGPAEIAGPQEIVPLPGDEPVLHPRLDDEDGEPQPETAAMLTHSRLINQRKKRRPAPEGFWPEFIYAITLHLVYIGDSVRVRERKALDARINKQFEGGTRFIPVLTRKGGVGKTTVTTVMGMAMATVRDDRIIAIDANPDRGTLAERVRKSTLATVRDVVNNAHDIYGFTDFSELVSRDETRLDILASDTDPTLSEAFDEEDYNIVAAQAAKYYSIALTDCGTGIVHSVMAATLQRADAIVIVSGGSVDEARLASETLTWLESNGYQNLARNAVVAINTATHATNLVKLEEIEAHFNSRVRAVVRMPYDPHLAAGSLINYRDLKPLTVNSARELAALVMDGLPVRRSKH